MVGDSAVLSVLFMQESDSEALNCRILSGEGHFKVKL
jgi:hypothetical protein